MAAVSADDETVEWDAARELVLVDRDAKRATGVATDLRYGAPLTPPVDVRAGEWRDLVGAGVVLICAGVNEKAGGATNRDDGRGRPAEAGREARGQAAAAGGQGRRQVPAGCEGLPGRQVHRQLLRRRLSGRWAS